MSARIVFAVAQYRTLPQGPLTVLADQDHDADGLGGHVLKVQDQYGTESYVLGCRRDRGPADRSGGGVMATDEERAKVEQEWREAQATIAAHDKAFEKQQAKAAKKAGRK